MRVQCAESAGHPFPMIYAILTMAAATRPISEHSALIEQLPVRKRLHNGKIKLNKKETDHFAYLRPPPEGYEL